MPGVAELAIIITIVLASLAVPVVILIAVLRIASGARRNSGLHEDEARIMQEIYQSLGRMEERIEALETLVLDPKDKVRAKD
ncbi:MAG: hypothetical protein K1Y02_22340 [Candidatus Hydrogenedentes bacterium]|nr:hypothetical protein [Candidatus Hydrogenedentota bacterium]